ncbi:MAG: HNH endonuclease [Parcubacteria group bacterium]|nr:HNH endonuclease [Parcubacteria group bacterium]
MDFDKETEQKVWEKGKIASNNDPSIWRKDACGAWIKRAEYGNRDSKYGWEIDHISADGSDNLSNLQPLQWENNLDKSDGKLKCNRT